MLSQYAKDLSLAVKTAGAVTPAAHRKVSCEMSQKPLLDLRVKLLSVATLAVACEERVGKKGVPLLVLLVVNVAQVPVVYHVPPLIMQPFFLPPVSTLRYPLPEKGALEAVLEGAFVALAVPDAVEDVGVGEDVVFLGRYCSVAGHEDFEPSGLEGTN